MIPRGFSAGVYTQTSDVEIEVNGLMTYDRKKIKIDEAKVREINQAICRSLEHKDRNGTKTIIRASLSRFARGFQITNKTVLFDKRRTEDVPPLVFWHGLCGIHNRKAFRHARFSETCKTEDRIFGTVFEVFRKQKATTRNKSHEILAQSLKYTL